MVGGERGDLPRKTDEWMLSSSFFLSFFLSVSLSAPTFGLSIRARDTNSTFFSSDVVMNLKNTKNRPKKKKKGVASRRFLPPFAKRKIPNFFLLPFLRRTFWVVGMYYEINNLDSSFVDPFLVRSNYIKFFSFVTPKKNRTLKKKTR